MKLRSFLYLDTKIVDDYISAIDGYLYEEEEITNSASTTTSKGVNASIKAISGNLGKDGVQTNEVKKAVKVSDAAKFDKVFDYIEDNEEIKYYEFLTEQDYNDIRRGDFLEILATSRFSKIKTYINVINKVNELCEVMQKHVDTPILDRNTKNTIKGINDLEQYISDKATPCVFEFDDNEYPVITYLNDEFLKCKQDDFIGEACLFCKVIRKIPEGKIIKLDEIFEDIQNLPLNRAQRRNMPKNLNNPREIKDEIKGPAVVVQPIAVYR